MAKEQGVFLDIRILSFLRHWTFDIRHSFFWDLHSRLSAWFAGLSEGCHGLLRSCLGRWCFV